MGWLLVSIADLSLVCQALYLRCTMCVSVGLAAVAAVSYLWKLSPIKPFLIKVSSINIQVRQ